MVESWKSPGVRASTETQAAGLLPSQTMKALSKSELNKTSNYVTLSDSVERMSLNPSNFKGLPSKPRC